MRPLPIKLIIFITAICIFYFLIRSFLLVYLVKGNSMNNILFDGDKVIVLKNEKYKLHSIIIAHKNNDNIVKRIIGLPGDTIRIFRDTVFNNLKCLSVERKPNSDDSIANNVFIMSYYHCNWTLDNFGPLFIPKEGSTIILDSINKVIYKNLIKDELHLTSDAAYESFTSNKKFYDIKYDYVFLLGDNFYQSFDSRMFGLVKTDDLEGVATFVLFSEKRISRIFKTIK